MAHFHLAVLIVAFLVGALGANCALRLGPPRDAAVLERIVCAEGALRAAATALAVDEDRLGLTVALLCAIMGAQNAVARDLAVPGLTTTLLTMSLAGIGVVSPGRGWRARG